MAKLNQYDILNSNCSGATLACVRVKLDRVILAEIRSCHSNPLKFLRTHPLSKERTEFVEQLRANDVPEDDIKLILTLPPVSK